MLSKRITVPFFAFVFITGTLFVAVPAHAQGPNDSNGNFFSGIVQFISQKFGLDKTQVQSAVNEYHAQHKASITPRPTMSAQDMQTRDKARLDKLVTDGKITSAQEQAILTELTTLRSKYSFDANQTPEQRRSQMKSMLEEATTWAKAQGIDVSYVMMFGGGRGMRGKGGPHEDWGAKSSASASPTLTPTQ